jgi:hypothetical protein
LIQKAGPRLIDGLELGWNGDFRGESGVVNQDPDGLAD